jgi:hypothetical protein
MFFNAFTYLAASALAVIQGSPSVTDGDTIRMDETRMRLKSRRHVNAQMEHVGNVVSNQRLR